MVARNRPYPAMGQSVSSGIPVETVILIDRDLPVEAQPDSSSRIAEQSAAPVVRELRAISEIRPRAVPKPPDTGLVAFPNHNPKVARRIRSDVLDPRLLRVAGHAYKRKLPADALRQTEISPQPYALVVRVEAQNRVRSGIGRKRLADNPPTHEVLHPIARKSNDPNGSIRRRG